MVLMGFRRGGVTLVWSKHHELHGLEVVMRRRPFGEFLDEWVTDADDAEWDDLSQKERAARTRRNAERLAEQIESWNFEDSAGRPIDLPPLDGTQEAIERRGDVVMQHCDNVMVQAMRDAYVSATTRVAPPLPESSDDGSPETGAPKPPEDWGPLQETTSN